MKPENHRKLACVVLLNTVVLISVVVAALFYVASVNKEMRRLRDEVDALRSDMSEIMSRQSTENVELGGYQGIQAVPDKHVYRKTALGDETEPEGRLHFQKLLDRHRRSASGRRKKKKVDFAHFESDAGMVHPIDVLKDWQYARWVDPKAKRKFVLAKRTKERGKVTVKSPGLYYVYAQVTFGGYRPHDFAIVKQDDKTGDEDEIVCCINSAEWSDKKDVSVLRTCHTSSLLLLGKNDKIYITNKIDDTGVFYNGSYSFFGMFKVR